MIISDPLIDSIVSEVMGLNLGLTLRQKWRMFKKYFRCAKSIYKFWGIALAQNKALDVGPLNNVLHLQLLQCKCNGPMVLS